MAGVNTDIVNGNLDGVASDAWTDAQVTTRREWAVEELLDEWETNGSASKRMPRCSGRPRVSGCTTRARTSTTSAARSVRPARRDSEAVAIGFEWGTRRPR